MSWTVWTLLRDPRTGSSRSRVERVDFLVHQPLPHKPRRLLYEAETEPLPVPESAPELLPGFWRLETVTTVDETLGVRCK